MSSICAVTASAILATAVSVFGGHPKASAASHDAFLCNHATAHHHGRQHHHARTRPARAMESVAALGSVPEAAQALQTLSVERSLDCKLTAYGPGFASTGKRPGDPGYGITAMGRMARPRHTVAVDPHMIPLGSLVYINGVGYRVAEDVGGAIRGSHIDVYFSSDGQARAFGVKRHVKVFVFSRASRSPVADAPWR